MSKTWLRAGMLSLTLAYAIPGLWAAVCPAWFYDAFPTPARGWARLFPPFNEHLVRDFGLMTLQFAIVLAFATVLLERRLVEVALLAFLAQNIGHLAFHATHQVAGSDLAVQFVALVGPIVVAVALLGANRVVNRPAGVEYAARTERSAVSDDLDHR
jgi:hypothetical protein